MLKPFDRRITLQLLVFYCCFLFPVLLGGVQMYFYERDALRASAQHANAAVAQSIALDVADGVRPAVDAVLTLAASRPATARDLGALGALHDAMADLLRANPSLIAFALCDASGQALLTQTQAAGTSQPALACQLAPASLLTPAPLIGALIAARGTETTSALPLATVAARVTDALGQPDGAIAAEVRLGQLPAQLAQARRQFSASARLWVLDAQGHDVAATEPASGAADLRASIPGTREALAGRHGNLIAASGQSDWLYTYEPVPDVPWAVVVQIPAEIAFADQISIRNSLIIALLTLIVGALFFWMVLHGWVVEPLTKLAHAASIIRPDQTENVTTAALLARDRARTDEIGELIAAFTTMEDEVHALFQASDARSEMRLHTLDAIMRSMEEGVLLERPDGHSIYANHSFTRFVGLAPSDVQPDAWVGQAVEEKLLALIEDPEPYQAALRNADGAEQSQLVEFRTRGHYNRAGRWVPIQREIRMRLFQVRDLAGQLVGRGRIFRDVTQQNEAEQIKRNLLAIVSHELRTPLTAIKGYATSLLEPDVTLETALHDRFLWGIVRESDRMAELVTNLLHMSQLEARTLRLSPAQHRLSDLIERSMTPEQRARIGLCIPDNLPLVQLDGRRIEVVLRNLLENAERHAGPGATIELTAECGDSRHEGGLLLSVTDSGPGLPPDLTERIFDRFYQIDGSRERAGSGVGLGLAICRGFVEAHGGRIWAENRTDGQRGAAFHIWLPPNVLHGHDAEPPIFELSAAL